MNKSVKKLEKTIEYYSRPKWTLWIWTLPRQYKRIQITFIVILTVEWEMKSPNSIFR